MLPRVPDLTRRHLLVGGAAVACVGGCTRHRPHVPTPRENLLDETLALEDSLLSSYDAALQRLGARPAAAAMLGQIRAAHAAHRVALLTAGAQPLPTTSPSPTLPPVAPSETTRTLAASETAAATIRTDSCMRAPRDLAPLLASLAASEAAHAALLHELR